MKRGLRHLAFRMMREEQGKVVAVTIATMISTALLYAMTVVEIVMLQFFSKNEAVVEKLFLHLTDGSHAGIHDGKSFLIGSFLLLAAFVLLGAFAPVYNMFSISIRSKADRYQVLSASGATISQLRKVVLTEAGVVGIIGTACGILAGLALNVALVRVLEGPLGVVLKTGRVMPVAGAHTLGVIALLAGIMLLTVITAAMLPTMMFHKITNYSETEAELERKRRKQYARVGRLKTGSGRVLPSLARRYMLFHRKSFASFGISSILSISLVVMIASFLTQVGCVMPVNPASSQESMNAYVLSRVLLVSVIVVMFIIELVSAFNAISSNVMEFRKDMVMFYAIGSTRSELGRIMRVECLLYVGMCTLVAVPIALAVSVVMNRMLFGISWMFPWNGVIPVIVCMISVFLLSVIYVNIKMRQTRMVETLRRFGT